jgi:hypothetical protein
LTFSVCVIDVGAPRSLGWALLREEVHSEIGDFEALIDAIAPIIETSGLALGFEAPLFLPRSGALRTFTAARTGEGNRAWSAGAGAAVTTIGLALLVHVLERLRERAPAAHVTLDVLGRPSPNILHVFEAFVSGPAKTGTHHGDALVAARAYSDMQRSIAGPVSAVVVNRPFSLVGAALLGTGWSTDLALLHSPCLVVKPSFLPQ